MKTHTASQGIEQLRKEIQCTDTDARVQTHQESPFRSEASFFLLLNPSTPMIYIA